MVVAAKLRKRRNNEKQADKDGIRMENLSGRERE